MKLAIPAGEKNLESAVHQSFGRAPFFAVVDSESMKFEVINNKAANAQGGAGIIAAQAVVDSGAGAAVAFQCGQNAANVLKAANIQIFKAVPGSVLEMVQKFNKGELLELTEIHSGYHRHGRE